MLFNLKGKKVLVLEDNFISAQLYKGMLEPLGMEIHFALTTQAAIELVRNNTKFDLVLLDLQLPDMNGLEAAKVIKAKNPRTPIIVQTAYAFDNYKLRSKEVGCDYFLTKPVKHDDLFNVLEKIFGK
jgi:CheY-like chemotaxis protein